MRTKGPAILICLFLTGFGLLLAWGGVICLQGAYVPAFLLFGLSLFSISFGIYGLRKIVLHFIRAAKLPQDMLHRFGSQFTLTFSDEARLRQQLAIVSRWTRRNLVIGVLFLLVAFLVPVRYIGLREFLRYSSSGGGYETLVRHSGGLLVFFLVGTVEGFLVYASRKERDRIKRDLEEKVKVILDGKVKGIDRSRFSTGPGNLVVQVGDMELDTFEIDSKFPRGHYRGVPVKVAIALHSQVVLAVEAAG